MKCEWDVENIWTLARSMNQEKERVERQIKELENCRISLSTALEGEAGTAIQDVLQENIIRMNEFSQMLDIQSKKLRAVGNKCYEQCEETLNGKMSETEANMK